MSDAKLVITAEDRATAVLRDVRGSVDSAVARFSALSGAAAALGAGAVLNAFRSVITSLDDLDEAAQGLQIAATTLANFRQAARETGIEADQFDGALTRLNVKISEAASGNREVARLFRELGVSVKDAAGAVRPTDVVFRDIADRFAQLRESPAKAALAVDLFGRSGAKLIPLLNGGAAGLERFAGASEETIKAAARLTTQFDRLAAAQERAANQTAGAIAPLLTDELEGYARGVEELEKRFKDLSGTQRFFAIISGDVGRELSRQRERQAQLNAALALGEGAYSNEGRAAFRSAQQILDNVRAKRENTRANRENRDSSLANVFEAEFRDARRIRENRRQLAEDVDNDNRAAAEAQRARIDDLFGRTDARRLAEDVALIDDEFFSGRSTIADYEAAIERAFGRQTQDKIKETRDAADQLGLVFASSIGQFIESGGAGGSRAFFDSLSKDLLKLTTQLLIVEPLAKAVRDALSGGGGGAAGGGAWISAAAGFFGSVFGGARADGGPVSAGRAYLVGERGPEMFVPRGSGEIVPNDGLKQSSSPQQPNIKISVNVQPGQVTQQTAKQIAAEAARSLTIASRRLN
jgi:hypothetical protein